MSEPQHRFLPQIDVEPPTVGIHYQNACIDEAVVEFRCEPPESLSLEKLATFMDDDARYTSREPLIEATGKVDISGEDVVGETTGSVVGYAHNREDGLRSVRAKLDGLGYSWTGPYETWEVFLGEAWELWRRYVEAASPQRLVRVGVRYINRFEVKGRHVEIKDYLRTGLDISPYLPQVVAGYFLQVQVPIHRYDGIATITSTMAPPSEPDSLALILDVDCWRGVDVDIKQGASESEILDVLADMRHMKNYVFEASITDAARGLIR